MESIFLIITKKEEKHEVIRGLLDTPGVLNAYSVYGSYDVIATIKSEDVAKYQEMIKNNISGIQLVNALITDFKKPTRQIMQKGER